MSKKNHFAGASLVAAVELYREFMGTPAVPGTGQTVGDLVHDGWTRLEIARYFPKSDLDLLLIIAAVGWMLYHSKRPGRERRRGHSSA
jgi:hypothetical protein